MLFSTDGQDIYLAILAGGTTAVLCDVGGQREPSEADFPLLWLLSSVQWKNVSSFSHLKFMQKQLLERGWAF